MTVASHSPEGTAVFWNLCRVVAIAVLMTIVVKEAFAPRHHVPFTWTADFRVHFAPEETLQPLFQDVEGQSNVTRDEWGQGLTWERHTPWGVFQEWLRGLHLWLNCSPIKAHIKLSSLLFLNTVLTNSYLLSVFLRSPLFHIHMRTNWSWMAEQQTLFNHRIAPESEILSFSTLEHFGVLHSLDEASLEAVSLHLRLRSCVLCCYVYAYMACIYDGFQIFACI